MNETELRQYNAIWNEAWKFFKHYAGMLPLPEEIWDVLIRSLPMFVDRHKEHEEFARKMILTIENELERQDKAIRRRKKDE